MQTKSVNISKLKKIKTKRKNQLTSGNSLVFRMKRLNYADIKLILGMKMVLHSCLSKLYFAQAKIVRAQ